MLASILAYAVVGSGGLLIQSCSDGVEPGPMTGQLSVLPTFESSAVRIVALNSLHIILTRSDSATVALDTVIAISDTKDTLDLSLEVVVLTDNESFFLEMELTDPDGEVLFRISPTVVTANTTGTASEPTIVELKYVGVGSDAVAVEITTTDVAVSFLDTALIEAVALDSLGEVIEGTPIGWSSVDETRASFPNEDKGNLVAGIVRGPVSVVAELLTGHTDTASVLVEPVPSTMTLVSGDGQAVVAEMALPEPLVVRVTAADDLGVEGVAIHYRLSQVGSLSADSTITDVDGIASVNWTLGNVVGDHLATAFIPGLPDVEVPFTATSGINAQLTGDGLAALEDALFIAVNALDDRQPPTFELTDLDLFSFTGAKDIFQRAFDQDPDNETAAFGLAIATLLSLEDDPTLREAADDWDFWVDNFDPDSLITGSGPFPPTLAEHQEWLESIVQPSLLEALDALNTVDDSAFVFTITTRMQGELPTPPLARELDLTEVLLLRALLETAVAATNVALAYEMTPSPYGVDGFEAALEPGSRFLMLAGNYTALLSDALARLRRAVDLLQEGLDFLVAEGDDQSDDVFIGPTDVQEARDMLADIEGALAGATTVNGDFGKGDVSLVVNATKFFLTIPDLKALLPAYEFTADGTFGWTALAFDEWGFPDHTFGGILPGITSSDDLKQKIDLQEMFEDGAFDIDEWAAVTQSPGDNAVFAITRSGKLREMPFDWASETDRPDVPGATALFVNHVVSLAANTGNSELMALTYDGRVFTRPDNATSPWTLRFDFASGIADGAAKAHRRATGTHRLDHRRAQGIGRIIEGPLSGNTYVLAEDGNLYELASDFSTAIDRPDLFYSVTDLTSTCCSSLVALTYDGLVFFRRDDDTTLWSQTSYTLPFDPFQVRPSLQPCGCLEPRGSSQDWIGLTRSPVDNNFFYITRAGDLWESASGVLIDRPDVPASNVVTLTINDDTDELLAVTEDGRVFTRPDDDASPWTLRRTLPRTILP